MVRKHKIDKDDNVKELQELDPYSQVEPNLPPVISQEPVHIEKEVCDNPEGY